MMARARVGSRDADGPELAAASPRRGGLKRAQGLPLGLPCSSEARRLGALGHEGERRLPDRWAALSSLSTV
jgi:hypothetical protein